MENDNLIYDYLNWTISLRKRLSALKHEKRVLEHKKNMAEVNSKIGHLVELLHFYNEYLENINNKEAATLLKLHLKTFSSSEDSVQICHERHEDFRNMLSNMEKLEKLVHDRVLHTKDGSENYNEIIKEFEKLNLFWQNKVSEGIIEYKSAIGFLENISLLNQLEEGKSSDDQKNDSDLGCYPHDSSPTSINTATLSEFVTSSPILNTHSEN